MLIVDDCLISDDLADRCFCCDIQSCRGACCVEGDCGAPLLEEEIPILQRILPQVRPYMSAEGLAVIDKEGVSALDNAEEPCTPLVNNKECAYLVYEDGIAYCAIEKAYRDGKIDFIKPISCHLYPIRVDDYGKFKTLNYHRWDVCQCAIGKGDKPLYQYLEEPLVRRFGREWYNELAKQCQEKNGGESK